MKKIEIIIQYENIREITFNVQYSYNDLKKWQYKSPANFNSFDEVFKTIKSNFSLDVYRFQMFLERSAVRKNFILDKINQFMLNGKNVALATFVMFSSVATIHSVNNVNYVSKYTTIPLVINNYNKPVTLKANISAAKLAKKIQKHKAKINTVKISNADKGVVEVIPNLPTLNYESKYWNTIATNVKSGTKVGEFKKSNFKISTLEKERRIKLVYNFFKPLEDTYCVNALVVTAQFIIESECGQSNLANMGNNFFGIKEFRNSFPFIRAIDDGNDLDDTGNSRFRKYLDVESGLLDYVSVVGKPLYKNVRMNYKDTNKYIYNLQHLHWSKTEKQWIRYADNDGYEKMLKSRISYIEKIVK